ncbi:MAG: hypothetical protein ACKVS9_19000 [Phycisphaerae bacterium]
MTADRLLNVLTEIRDQQRKQVENFEAALRAQDEYNRIQTKSRKMFAFLVYAPWIALVCVLGGVFVPQWIV